MSKFDVCALGELLIDFTENGLSPQGNPIMEANPGGAPCNVLSMLCRQGYKTAFIGKIGDDIFGRQLRETVEDIGINTEGLVTDRFVNTTLAFVHTLEGGDREFSFYRNPGADMMLNESDINEKIIAESRIFHYGSLSMTNEICEAATKKAVAAAESSGALISFDPNLRENLWDNLETAREKIEYGLSHCDILKISDNEIRWLTGENDFDAAVKMIREKYTNISLLLLSLGKDGSRAYSQSGYASAPITPANTIETTGAGDTFCGAILGRILEYGMRDFSDSELKEMLVFANAAAGIVTERKGALKVMPTMSEISDMIRMNTNNRA
ncbi:MAG: carbohydrate kinase [Oscillospiraceae bacterium]|nr:carbohydrate kinase [Oscillospiraceae bacterium]